MPIEFKVPEARLRRERSRGHWLDLVLSDCLDRHIQERPDHPALIAVDSRGQETRLTYRELLARADRIALGLIALGIEKGDVVSYQLPNWWEFTALTLACFRIGAVVNPLMPIFRERELRFMLDLTESKLFVTPRRFRNFNYSPMVESIRGGLPHLKHTLVVGDEREPGSFEAELVNRPWEEEMHAAQLFRERRPEADDLAEILFTSGTTGEPKGVMHTTNTLLSNLRPYIERLRLGPDGVYLMASPMAHQTGMLYGLILPFYVGGTQVLQDIWDPRAAAGLIEEHRITFTMAATPFLADLTQAVEDEKADTSSLAVFMCGGAPVPSVLVERSSRVLGARIVSAWGMTENGAVTTTKLDDPVEKVFHTDGCLLAGMEIRIADPVTREPLPPGAEGCLLVRGCSDFIGYLKRPELYAHDAEGWFDTGDFARLDADGYVRITGRSKDIIIRGGENIPVVEIEALLLRHPAIQSVAIVGYSDQRLGERACAFVILKPQATFDMAEMSRYLAQEGTAQQYFPERLEIVDTLPTTLTGKIQKFVLREQLTQEERAAAANR